MNAHETFGIRPRRLLNVLSTFNLRPVSTGNQNIRIFKIPLYHGEFITHQLSVLRCSKYEAPIIPSGKKMVAEVVTAEFITAIDTYTEKSDKKWKLQYTPYNSNPR